MTSTRKFLMLILMTCISDLRCISSANTNATVNSSENTREAQRIHDRIGTENSFSLNKNNNLEGRQNLNFREDGSGPVSVIPSFSYQFHTNDHVHLDKIVMAHQNSNEPTQNSVGGSFRVNSGLNGISRGDDLQPLSSDFTISTSSRRLDTVANSPSFPFPYSYPASSSTPAYHTEQNQDWRIESINGGNFQSKQPIWVHHYHQQQQQPHELSTPKAVSQGKPMPQRVPLDLGNDINPVSSLYNMGNIEISRRRNVSAVSAGKRRQRPNLSTLKRRRPVVRHEGIRNGSVLSSSPSSSSFVYSHPHESHRWNGNENRMTHNQGQQLQTIANSLNNRNASVVYSSVSTRQKFEPNNLYSLQPSPPEKQGKQGKRKILTSRADSYQGYEEDDVVDDDDNDDTNDDGETNNYYHDHDHHDHEEEDVEDQNDEENSEYYYGQYGVDNLPALRDIPQQQFGQSGPGLPGPLPPPPVPQKGSIDYILIPLILIGLAGPVFVVLYVVLGAFEFKIAPIARSFSSGYASYQPYIDSVTSSVGRALEKYECVDYATCKVRGFCDQLDFLSSSNSVFNMDTIESAISSFTPAEHKESLKGVFNHLKNMETHNCEKYKCSSFLTQLPVKF